MSGAQWLRGRWTLWSRRALARHRRLGACREFGFGDGARPNWGRCFSPHVQRPMAGRSDRPLVRLPCGGCGTVVPPRSVLARRPALWSADIGEGPGAANGRPAVAHAAPTVHERARVRRKSHDPFGSPRMDAIIGRRTGTPRTPAPPGHRAPTVPPAPAADVDGFRRRDHNRPPAVRRSARALYRNVTPVAAGVTRLAGRLPVRAREVDT